MHGRWGYRRISNFIFYYFYKNIVMVACEIFFALFNGFSGQIYFVDWLPMLFNGFWTSWPCLVNFSLDQDVNKKISLKYPKLYGAGHNHYYFNFKSFWKHFITAIIHGGLCFWLPILVIF